MQRFFCVMLLCVSSFDIYATKIHTGKTFLLPQSFRFPTQYTFYDHVRTMLNKHEALWGGSLQITSFYRRDQNKKEIGQYFGRNGSNIISIGSGKTDFQATNLIFSNNPSSLNLSGKLELLPFRKVRGLNFSYMRRLPRLSKQLFFCVTVPWVHVTRRMQAYVHDEQKDIVEGHECGILDYFRGCLRQTGYLHNQEPLRCAKIKSGHSDYRTGFGDLACFLSYQYTRNKKNYLRSLAGAIFPTSSKPKGKTLFEPLIGNGGQFGVFTGIELMTALHKSEHIKIKAIYGCNLKYFFRNTQTRMISFRSDDLDSRRSWAHYYGLLGEQGKVGVFPAANVLTRDVRVTPGFVFDFFFNGSVSYRNFLLSAGYNFFSRDAESICVKKWRENRYALASPIYDTTTAFNIVYDPNPATDDNIEGPIQRNMLDTSVAETPALTTHKIYVMATAFWDDLRTPVTLGIGGAYEFSKDNAVIEGYELFMKAGMLF